MATRKWDGTACLFKNGKLYKRYDAKQGKEPPAGFIPAQENPDPITLHWPGWVEVSDSPADRWHREAVVFGDVQTFMDGLTYELCGPKIQGNPENLDGHWFIPHGYQILPDCPRNFDELKTWLAGQDIEGIVWHHPDGRMVKIKKKDFGLERKPKKG